MDEFDASFGLQSLVVAESGLSTEDFLQMVSVRLAKGIFQSFFNGPSSGKAWSYILPRKLRVDKVHIKAIVMAVLPWLTVGFQCRAKGQPA